MKRFGLKLLLYLAITAAVIAVLFAILPYNHDGYMRAQLYKDSLLRARTQPSLVLLGGSNVAFGFDSHRMEQALGVPVVNDGMHGYMGMRMIMDNYERVALKGDVVVVMPEYIQYFNELAEGEQPMVDLAYLSPRDYLPLLKGKQRLALAKFTSANLRARIEYAISSWLIPDYKTIYRASAFNDLGDVTGHWDDTTGVEFVTLTTPLTEHEPINEGFVTYLHETLDRWVDSGLTVIVCPPAYAVTAYNNILPNIRCADSLMRDMGHPFACPPEQMLLPDSMFYDTDYHLNGIGAQERTTRMIEVLKPLLTPLPTPPVK